MNDTCHQCGRPVLEPCQLAFPRERVLHTFCGLDCLIQRATARVTFVGVVMGGHSQFDNDVWDWMTRHPFTYAAGSVGVWDCEALWPMLLRAGCSASTDRADEQVTFTYPGTIRALLNQLDELERQREPRQLHPQVIP